MNEQTKEFLVRLVNSIGPSGYEDEVAAVWEAEARTFAAEVTRDAHGNTDAIVNPGGSPRIMLSGHYDEIGFLITHIDDDGYVWFDAIGGWDSQIVQGQRVVIRGKEGRVPGVVGKCPIHLQKPEERKKVMEIREMWIDIGVTSREEAEALVGIGDPMVLAQDYVDLQGGRAAARGFDNRSGAFVVLEAARLAAGLSPTAEIHAVATVQEEIGLRGARTAAFGIDPSVGIAVDVTFATDQPGIGDAVKREGKIKLGQGAVISRGANINAKLFELLRSTAVDNEIPFQVNAEPGGTGTDANAIQLNRAGVATALVSIPNRYMHSPSEMVSLDDLDACIRLIGHTIAGITPETNWIPF